MEGRHQLQPSLSPDSSTLFLETGTQSHSKQGIGFSCAIIVAPCLSSKHSGWDRNECQVPVDTPPPCSYGITSQPQTLPPSPRLCDFLRRDSWAAWLWVVSDPVNYADPGSHIIHYSGPACGPAWAVVCGFWFLSSCRDA